MGQDTIVRTTTEVEGLIEKRNECLKAIANKIALLANQRKKDGEKLSSNSITNMVKELSYEEQVQVLAATISAMVSSNNSSGGGKNSYDPSALFKGRGF